MANFEPTKSHPKEAKTEIQAEIKKSQAMVQRLEKEVQMAKQPTESMRALTDQQFMGHKNTTKNECYPKKMGV